MFRNSRFNPGPGIADFWQEFRKPTPHRWPILAVSALPILLIFYWASSEEVVNPLERPTVTYITSYAPDRSDEEIIASNIANQQEKDERRAKQEEVAERKKDLYRALGRAAGMDVDGIERDIAAEREQEAAVEQGRSPDAPTQPQQP